MLMKYKILAILQLQLMLFYIGKPLLPYIEYAVFKDYIAKNLCINRDNPKSCCQGKCHLKKQIERTSETSETENKGSNKKVSSQEISVDIIAPVTIPKAIEIDMHRNANHEIAVPMKFVSPIFIPPDSLITS